MSFADHTSSRPQVNDGATHPPSYDHASAVDHLLSRPSTSGTRPISSTSNKRNSLLSASLLLYDPSVPANPASAKPVHNVNHTSSAPAVEATPIEATTVSGAHQQNTYAQSQLQDAPSHFASAVEPEVATFSEARSVAAHRDTAAAGMPAINSAQEINAALLTTNPDPLNFGRHKREVSKQHIKAEHPKASDSRGIREFYVRQNELIDQFLAADDEEKAGIEESTRMTPKIKFAVRASFVVNLCLFVIQMYAAISTGSLALFATAADAFMDLVSSFVMLTTSLLAARPSIYKYPVGRRRIETVGIILFCALMTTVAIQLLIESGRHLAGGHQDSEPLAITPIVFVSIAIFAKGSMMVYCFFYRRYPSVHIFFVDHRNDIVVNIFGLATAILGSKLVWYLDPIGAIVIALIILFSWVSNAFEQVWLLVGKSAPRDFLAKLIYMAVVHDDRILHVDTCRAYHAGQQYYVEVDIVMDPETPLHVSHDVAQSLQRKYEGLIDVERAFVHVDYEHDHLVHEEHKPLYERNKTKMSLREKMRAGFWGHGKNDEKETERLASGAAV